VTDIIGTKPDLGVENLKDSGLISGETSAAYNDIFTMTIVLGRTVGIDVYLVRLGQRTIQKTTGSPINLTGYQALDKLMGVDVYSTNDQLGGPGIMYSNGVSYLAEPDHLRAIMAAINWLVYMTSHRGGLLPQMKINEGAKAAGQEWRGARCQLPASGHVHNSTCCCEECEFS
jgi:acetyl-CoA carboxylase / biotin carboxylase 1